MFSAVADGFGYLFRLIWEACSWVLDGIYWLLKPVFDLLGGIFYFIFKIGVVLYKVLEIVVTVVKLLIGLATGLFRTIFGLSYSGQSAVIPDSYMTIFGKLQPIFASLQLNKVAYLLSFGVWIMAAFVAMRIIGGMRGAGSSG